MEYKCNKHKSNEGFIDLSGKWNCWLCYKDRTTLKVGDTVILIKSEFGLSGFLNAKCKITKILPIPPWIDEYPEFTEDLDRREIRFVRINNDYMCYHEFFTLAFCVEKVIK